MNDHTPEPAVSEPLPTGRMEGRQIFGDLVRQALAVAAQEGWPHIVLSDTDFSDWPLGERAVIESLQAWAFRGREIRFLARDFAAAASGPSPAGCLAHHLGAPGRRPRGGERFGQRAAQCNLVARVDAGAPGPGAQHPGGQHRCPPPHRLA